MLPPECMHLGVPHTISIKKNSHYASLSSLSFKDKFLQAMKWIIIQVLVVTFLVAAVAVSGADDRLDLRKGMRTKKGQGDTNNHWSKA